MILYLVRVKFVRLLRSLFPPKAKHFGTLHSRTSISIQVRSFTPNKHNFLPKHPLPRTKPTFRISPLMPTKHSSDNLKMTISSISIPRTKYFSQIATPAIPREPEGVTDRWFLYLIFEASKTGEKVDWSPAAIKVNTLRMSYQSDVKHDQPVNIRTNFSKLPVEARNTWNTFVEEMEERPELKGRLIVTPFMGVEGDSRFVVKVLTTQAPK